MQAAVPQGYPYPNPNPNRTLYWYSSFFGVSILFWAGMPIVPCSNSSDFTLHSEHIHYPCRCRVEVLLTVLGTTRIHFKAIIFNGNFLSSVFVCVSDFFPLLIFWFDISFTFFFSIHQKYVPR